MSKLLLSFVDNNTKKLENFNLFSPIYLVLNVPYISMTGIYIKQSKNKISKSRPNF